MTRTVLAVDDERNMLSVIRMTLEQAGYRVIAPDMPGFGGTAQLPRMEDS